MKENRSFSQRYAIATTHLKSFRWLIARLLNYRISFQMMSCDQTCHSITKNGSRTTFRNANNIFSCLENKAVYIIKNLFYLTNDLI